MITNYLISLLKLCRLLTMMAMTFAFSSLVNANFELSTQLTTTGSKSGGVALADYNNDNCVDALVNTDDAGSPFLYTQDFIAGQCNSTFTQSRSFNENTNRSIVWGDFDNDGFIDFAANASSKVIIYQNVNGTATGFVEVADFNPGNSEGMSWIDYDADGDLDLFVENQEFGIRIYTNNNGTISSLQLFELHSGSAEGDYAAVADYDIDGDVDIYVRRGGLLNTDAEADLFVNTGNSFIRDTSINFIASNIDKGGAAFCDFDGDGDLDLIRTNDGPNQIFERTASGWTPRTDTDFDALSPNNDGVGCADIDNDGNVDLIFNTVTGDAVVYRNDGGFIFTANNMDITASGEGKGLAFTDFDRDGDMDVLFNIHNAANQLWVNDTNGTDYLIVQATVSGRVALGATVQLFACGAGVVGSAVLGSRDISGGGGRGSQNEGIAHFGLSTVGGASVAYVARTTFVGGKVVNHAVRPDTLGTYQAIKVDAGDNDNLNACDNDGDGIFDNMDLDDDNDGIPDITEGNGDPDGDGVINAFDIDADGDGIADNIEAQAEDAYQAPLNIDTDGDGLDDRYDSDTSGTPIIIINTDNIDTPDYLDNDSDNDNIDDLIEGHDANSDGIADVSPAINNADADNDGLNDNFDTFSGAGNDNAIGSNAPLQNTDGADNRDWRDTDDDNDTVLTSTEGNVSNDANNNGTPDYLEPSIVDTDGDGVTDELDAALNDPCIPSNTASVCDTDNDSLTDGDEIANGTNPNNADTDGDSIPDGVENRDFDNDGINDGIDTDSDNDGIPDATEAGTNPLVPTDSDGDGTPDFQDTDSDNDGIPDALEVGPVPNSPVDTDGDGMPNYVDTDSDNDGINDQLEGTADLNNNGLPDYIDSQGQLETAVRGAGSSGIGFLLFLASVALVRYRRTFTITIAPVLIVAIILSAAPLHDANAESLCGHYTDTENPRLYYEGDDPERDKAGYQTCWYAGIGLGYSYVSPDEEANNFFHDGNENHDGGYHLFIGKQLSPHWFAELKYADLGEAGITNRNPVIAAAFPDAAITYKVPSLMAAYQWRVDKNWKPFAKIGLSAITNKAIGGPIPFDKKTSVQLAFGAGIKYDFGRSPWFLRGDFDWYDLDAWYSGISLGLQFGHKATERPVVVPPTDNDGDGVIDNSDQCLNTPAGESVDETGCPPLKKDSDKDGVLDESDICPLTQPGVDVDASGCNPDKDGDGVVNIKDQCPNTTPGVVVDKTDGCEIKVDIQLPGLQFETNSGELRAGTESILNSAAQTLINNPGLVVEVAGYTDSRGDANYNRELSERRANTVRHYLVEHGVSAKRLTAAGYGESDPVADNATPDGRAKNRRVMLRILNLNEKKRRIDF